jgi:hypothetical protein
MEDAPGNATPRLNRVEGTLPFWAWLKLASACSPPFSTSYVLFHVETSAGPSKNLG